MRVQVAEQQRRLEEQDACVPDRWASSKPWQREFREHRFDQEQETRSREHRCRKDRGRPARQLRANACATERWTVSDSRGVLHLHGHRPTNSPIAPRTISRRNAFAASNASAGPPKKTKAMTTPIAIGA